MGPGGFYRPSNRSGAKLRLHMMCFGRLWDPVTKYEKSYRSDGSAPPPLPYEFISLAENAIEDAQLHMNLLPSMLPDICVANFYSYNDRLGLHQDCDEHVGGLDRGLPVVSVSIGESAEFLYGHTRDENKLEKVLLESGDVLIFGGKSRRIFHGVRRILPPLHPIGVSQVIKETGLILGRLNLTLKQS
ncbi:putative DNA oxidative demethylase [Helianthus annuus]|nr:putative DNA oxidative demethylase [Helianthus annuus]